MFLRRLIMKILPINDRIKSLILKDYEPSPPSCLQNFGNAKRLHCETNQQFDSRLRFCDLRYYIIRDCKHFISLITLIRSEKIRNL